MPDEPTTGTDAGKTIEAMHRLADASVALGKALDTGVLNGRDRSQVAHAREVLTETAESLDDRINAEGFDVSDCAVCGTSPRDGGTFPWHPAEDVVDEFDGIDADSGAVPLCFSCSQAIKFTGDA